MNRSHRTTPLAALGLGLFTLCAAAPLSAQAKAHEHATTADSTRVLDRLDPERAERALVTREGDVALLIHGSDLVVQLTDRGLDDLRAPQEGDGDSFAHRLLGTMLRAGLRELLDHSIAYPIADITRAELVGERLVLENHEGNELFDMTVNDRELLEDFDPAEARAFARHLRSRMPAAAER